MSAKTKKIILLAIVVTAGAAALIGYTLYNKKHFSVKNTTPVAIVAAVLLHQTFNADSALAKINFIGDETNKKVIKVTGEIAAIKEDQQGNTIILLKTATDGAFINCTLEGKAQNINAGNTIAIKGICSGYNFDADMGIPGDVILVRCFLTK
jgi:tRNA_anti-like